MLDPQKGAKLCECGCGQPTLLARVTNRRKGHTKGEPLRFINGHNRTGGGERDIFFNQGRWWVAKRDGTSIAWARVVMENHIERPLEDKEIVHHENEDSADDRIDNLKLYASQSEHMKAEHLNHSLVNMLRAGISGLPEEIVEKEIEQWYEKQERIARTDLYRALLLIARGEGGDPMLTAQIAIWPSMFPGQSI